MFNVDNMGEKVENMLDKKFDKIIAKHFSPLEELLETVKSSHIKLCFVVLKAWVKKQYKLSNLVSLSAGLGQRRSINKQNGGLGYLVFDCPLTSFVLLTLGLFEFIFLNN